MSRRWKEIREDPERLIKYDNSAKYRRDKAEKVKPTELGEDKHDSLVGDMVQHEEKVTEKSMVKKNTNTTQKSPKVPRVFWRRLRGLRQ